LPQFGAVVLGGGGGGQLNVGRPQFGAVVAGHPQVIAVVRLQFIVALQERSSVGRGRQPTCVGRPQLGAVVRQRNPAVGSQNPGR
jgi:hypothetical protein